MSSVEQLVPLFDPGILRQETGPCTCNGVCRRLKGDTCDIIIPRYGNIEIADEDSDSDDSDSSLSSSEDEDDDDDVGGETWGGVPSIALEGILRTMTYCERLRVTSVCKRWRSALYTPSLWYNVELYVDTKREGKKAYFLTKCIRFAKHIKIHWPALDVCHTKGHIYHPKPLDLHNKETLKALFQAMKSCSNIKTLILKLENPCAFSPDFSRPVQNCMHALLPNNDHLVSVSFGCNSTIIPPNIVDLICAKKRLHELHIAHYRPAYSSSNMDTIPVLSSNDYQSFSKMKNLRQLTVDWCNVSAGLLQGLTTVAVHLNKLNILVSAHPCTHAAHPSGSDWQLFAKQHPKIKISLTFVRRFHGVCPSLELIQPDVFLIKVLECHDFVIDDFVQLLQWQQQTLKAIVFMGVWDSINIDSGPTILWPTVASLSNLKHLAILKHFLLDDMLVFVTSHFQLENFLVTKSHVMMYAEETPYLIAASASKYNQFRQEISAILGRPWQALDKINLQGFYFAEGKDDKTYF